MLLFTAMNTLHINHHNVAKTKTKPDKLNTAIAILRREDNADTQSYGDEKLIQNVKDSATLPSFIRMRNPDWVIGNVDHICVLDLVDGVAADIGHFSTFGD